MNMLEREESSPCCEACGDEMEYDDAVYVDGDRVHGRCRLPYMGLLVLGAMLPEVR